VVPFLPRPDSIRVQLLVLILLVGLPVAALAIYSGLERRAGDQREAEASALRLAESYERYVSARVDAAGQILRPVSLIVAPYVSSDTRIDSLAACRARLAPFVTESYVRAIAVVRPDGEVVCGSTGIKTDALIQRSAFIEQALASVDSVPGPVVMGVVADDWSLPVYFAVRNREGVATGVVVALIDLDELTPPDIIQSLPEQSFVTVTDRLGQVIGRYPDSSNIAIGHDATNGPTFQRARREGSGVVGASNADGVPSYIGYTSITEMGDGAFIFVGLNRELAIGAAQAGLWRHGLMFLFFTTLAVGVTWFGSQWLIVGPLGLVRETADRMTVGELSARVGPKYPPGEIGDLGAAFDRMANSIAEQRTEIVELNESLEQRVRERTAALQDANRELEAFSYSVSHDLRAPLRAVHSFAELLSEELDGSQSDAAQMYLRRLLVGTDRMGELIDDLLNFARVGRQQLNPQPLDLDALVRESIDEVLPQYGNPAIDWHVGFLGEVVADRPLLRHVLDNLLGNAIKFSRNAEAPRIELGRRDIDGVATYYVRDNGVGFDMANSARLFDIFQRLHSQEEFDGTGVGLATVERIINRHGGRIWADAAPGQGATFTFTLGEPDLDRSGRRAPDARADALS